MWTPHRGLAAPNTQVSTLAGQLHCLQLGHVDPSCITGHPQAARGRLEGRETTRSTCAGRSAHDERNSPAVFGDLLRLGTGRDTIDAIAGALRIRGVVRDMGTDQAALGFSVVVH